MNFFLYNVGERFLNDLFDTTVGDEKVDRLFEVNRSLELFS